MKFSEVGTLHRFNLNKWFAACAPVRFPVFPSKRVIIIYVTFATERYIRSVVSVKYDDKTVEFELYCGTQNIISLRDPLFEKLESFLASPQVRTR